MMKRIVLLLVVLSLGVALAACNDGGRVMDDPDPSELIELTLEELAEYDGLDGSDAYIAVDGKIYDVSDDPNWRNGSHNGFQAGQDLTEEIGSVSPHGTAVLDGVPWIGNIVESVEQVEDPNEDENPDLTVYMTISDLAEYDGQNGTSAYISYMGVIYDVTDVEEWQGGSHNGVSAGQDITVEIGFSPHGTSMLIGLTIVGELVVSTEGDGPYDPYLYLTVEELSEFDGQDGQKAYIAVSGLIYDVTDNHEWRGGDHEGYDAGQDLTDEILSASPHGVAVLGDVVIVGELIDE